MPPTTLSKGSSMQEAWALSSDDDVPAPNAPQRGPKAKTTYRLPNFSSSEDGDGDGDGDDDDEKDEILAQTAAALTSHKAPPQTPVKPPSKGKQLVKAKVSSPSESDYSTSEGELETASWQKTRKNRSDSDSDFCPKRAKTKTASGSARAKADIAAAASSAPRKILARGGPSCRLRTPAPNRDDEDEATKSPRNKKFTREEDMAVIESIDKGHSIKELKRALPHRADTSLRDRRRHFVAIMGTHAGK
ncbi:unnamed protein product [Parajaminaea phylloscopi]